MGSDLDVGEIAAIGFWASLVASTVLAVLGVLRTSARVLLLSAVCSLPFGLIMFGYPSGRYFLALPAFHWVAAFAVQRRTRWVSWIMLALIGAFAVWFLVLRIVL